MFDVVPVLPAHPSGRRTCQNPLCHKALSRLNKHSLCFVCREKDQRAKIRKLTAMEGEACTKQWRRID